MSGSNGAYSCWISQFKVIYQAGFTDFAFLLRLLRQYIKHVSVYGPFSWNKNGFPFFKTNFLQNKCSKLFTGIKSRWLRQYINTCFDLWSLFHEIKIAFHSLKLTFSKINVLNFLLEFNQDYWDNISIHVSVYGPSSWIKMAFHSLKLFFSKINVLNSFHN